MCTAEGTASTWLVLQFLAACNSLGGPQNATPKQILMQMAVSGAQAENCGLVQEAQGSAARRCAWHSQKCAASPAALPDSALLQPSPAGRRMSASPACITPALSDRFASLATDLLLAAPLCPGLSLLHVKSHLQKYRSALKQGLKGSAEERGKKAGQQQATGGC
jgi:hypothetical protein